jgi:hypothetical protein
MRLALDHADLVHELLEGALPFVGAFGFDLIKACAQGFLFVALAIVPWAALQPHHHNIVANKMRFHACLQQSAIGFIRPEGAQVFSRMYSSFGATGVHCGAKIADRGNGTFHPVIVTQSPLRVTVQRC